VANKPNKTIAGKILVTARIIKVFLVKKNTSTKIGKTMNDYEWQLSEGLLPENDPVKYCPPCVIALHHFVDYTGQAISQGKPKMTVS